ncbi:MULTISPECIES: hypothetical protein [unclassified Streptomyces]|uniref:hypothetical protein n=1 Tax=unclassified Streptomyces TaxID=2593676 RepID=UPI0035DC70B9
MSPGVLRVQCGARVHLAARFLAAARTAGVPGGDHLPRTVRCVIEHHQDDAAHLGILAELPLTDPGEIWASWLDGHDPHDVQRRPYCPARDEDGTPCELHQAHDDGHSWELAERHVTAT